MGEGGGGARQIQRNVNARGLQNGPQEATLAGTRGHRVNAKTGWPGD